MGLLSEDCQPSPNVVLKGRDTTVFDLHTGTHPAVIENILDRLKGTDDEAHDVILALFRQMHLVRNRADYLGDKLVDAMGYEE